MSEAWSGGSDTRWRRFRALVLRLDLPPAQRPTCAIQGRKCITVATHVDHITPLSKGGKKYDRDNVRPACEPCNTGRRVAELAYEPQPKKVSNW